MRSWTGSILGNLAARHSGRDLDEGCPRDGFDNSWRGDGGYLARSQVDDKAANGQSNVEPGRVRVVVDQRRNRKRGHKVRDEEDAIRILAHTSHGCACKSVERCKADNAGKDDRGEEALDPDSRLEEEDVVKDGVEDEQEVDDPT